MAETNEIIGIIVAVIMVVSTAAAIVWNQTSVPKRAQAKALPGRVAAAAWNAPGALAGLDWDKSDRLKAAGIFFFLGCIYILLKHNLDNGPERWCYKNNGDVKIERETSITECKEQDSGSDDGPHYLGPGEDIGFIPGYAEKDNKIKVPISIILLIILIGISYGIYNIDKTNYNRHLRGLFYISIELIILFTIYKTYEGVSSYWERDLDQDSEIDFVQWFTTDERKAICKALSSEDKSVCEDLTEYECEDNSKCEWQPEISNLLSPKINWFFLMASSYCLIIFNIYVINCLTTSYDGTAYFVPINSSIGNEWLNINDITKNYKPLILFVILLFIWAIIFYSVGPDTMGGGSWFTLISLILILLGASGLVYYRDEENKTKKAKFSLVLGLVILVVTLIARGALYFDVQDMGYTYYISEGHGSAEEKFEYLLGAAGTDENKQAEARQIYREEVLTERDEIIHYRDIIWIFFTLICVGGIVYLKEDIQKVGIVIALWYLITLIHYVFKQRVENITHQKEMCKEIDGVLEDSDCIRQYNISMLTDKFKLRFSAGLEDYSETPDPTYANWWLPFTDSKPNFNLSGVIYLIFYITVVLVPMFLIDDLPFSLLHVTLSSTLIPLFTWISNYLISGNIYNNKLEDDSSKDVSVSAIDVYLNFIRGTHKSKFSNYKFNDIFRLIVRLIIFGGIVYFPLIWIYKKWSQPQSLIFIMIFIISLPIVLSKVVSHDCILSGDKNLKEIDEDIFKSNSMLIFQQHGGLITIVTLIMIGIVKILSGKKWAGIFIGSIVIMVIAIVTNGDYKAVDSEDTDAEKLQKANVELSRLRRTASATCTGTATDSAINCAAEFAAAGEPGMRSRTDCPPGCDWTAPS